MKRKIKIGGHEYKINYEALLEKDDLGSSNIDGHYITIKKGLSPKESRDTLIHEIIHQCLSVGGLSFGMNELTEESIVRCLEHLLIPALEDIGLINKQGRHK